MQQPEELSPKADIGALTALLELRNRIGFVYGSEEIAVLLYAMIRRERPAAVLELGTGLGVTALWIAQALKENGGGRIWTLDDGSHWTDAAKFQAAMNALGEAPPFDALDKPALDYPTFVDCMIQLLDLGRQVTFLKDHLDLTDEAGFTAERWPFLARPIDMVFLDIDRKPDDILDMVNDMLKPSIDLCTRAGTIHVAQQTPATA